MCVRVSDFGDLIGVIFVVVVCMCVVIVVVLLLIGQLGGKEMDCGGCM
jgi:uncharacterized membrane protein